MTRSMLRIAVSAALVLTFVVALIVVVPTQGQIVEVEVPPSLEAVLQQMQLKSAPSRQACFDNQQALNGLLTDWQPFQPPGPTTMELNQWVIATVQNAQLLALCAQWPMGWEDTNTLYLDPQAGTLMMSDDPKWVYLPATMEPVPN